MAKRNDVGLVVVVVLAIFGAVWYGTTLATKSVGVPSGTTGTGTATSTGQFACSQSGSPTPTISLSAFYNDTSTVPATPTQLAESYKVYQQGGVLALASGTSSSSAATSITGVNCGSSYNIFLGGNTNHFVTEVNVQVTQAPQVVQVAMVPISSPTVTFNNGTIAGYVSQAKFFSVPNGYTETQLQMKIAAGSGFFGNPDFAVMFAYNASQISSVQLSYPTVSVPSSVVSTVPAGYSTVAYQLPQIGNYQSEVLNPIIKTSTLPSNTAVASPINVYLVSQSSYNQNGQLVTGAFTNTNGAALVTPVSSVASSSGSDGILLYG
jgi:hypothetical protein